MNLNIEKWKDFVVGDVFLCETTSALDINEAIIGSIPYITRSTINNGLTDYYGNTEKIVKGNCITIGAEGTIAFYQPDDFIPGVKLYTLRHSNLNEINAMFIVTVLNSYSYIYSYGRARILDKLKQETIKLPCTEEGTPNWTYMENYIKNLNYKPISTQRKSNIKNIEFNKWHEFRVEDIFNIYNGKGITSEEIEFNPGNFNAIQSGEENNGIIGKIDKNYCIEKKYTLTENQCLTVARTGSAGFVSYQPEGCVVGDSAKILILKEKERANKYIYLFLRTILMANKYKYTYGRKVTEDKYLKEKIMLPSKKIKNEEFIPDWDFMEKYIRELPYGDRI